MVQHCEEDHVLPQHLSCVFFLLYFTPPKHSTPPPPAPHPPLFFPANKQNQKMSHSYVSYSLLILPFCVCVGVVHNINNQYCWTVRTMREGVNRWWNSSWLPKLLSNIYPHMLLLLTAQATASVTFVTSTYTTEYRLKSVDKNWIDCFTSDSAEFCPLFISARKTVFRRATG